MQNQEIFMPLFKKMETTSIRVPFTSEMKKQSDELFKGLNLNFINKRQKNVINQYALWLMSIMQVHKGGMKPASALTRRRSVLTFPRTDLNKEEENLHEEVIYRHNEKRKRNAPSMRYIFMLCLLAGIALFLIIESYERLIELSTEINSATVDNRFIQILNEVLSEENPNQVNDGGFTFYLWNSLAKLVNLNRMPTPMDTDNVRLRLMQEITQDVSSQMSKGLIQCGGVLTPMRSDYPSDIKGTLSYNVAMSVAAATNFAGGSAPFYCAASVMGTKTSFALTKFMADSAITIATLTSKVTIIKNFMSYAFFILAFTVPVSFKLIQNAFSPHDIALIEYRTDIKNGHILAQIRQAGEEEEEEEKQQLQLEESPPVEEKKEKSSPILQIENGGAIRRLKKRATKRKFKQTKKTKTKTRR